MFSSVLKKEKKNRRNFSIKVSFRAYTSLSSYYGMGAPSHHNNMFKTELKETDTSTYL